LFAAATPPLSKEMIRSSKPWSLAQMVRASCAMAIVARQTC
jgi:hypothetical protein